MHAAATATAVGPMPVVRGHPRHWPLNTIRGRLPEDHHPALHLDRNAHQRNAAAGAADAETATIQREHGIAHGAAQHPVLHVEESRGPVQVPAIAAASRRDASSMQERMDAFGQATADAMDDTDLVDPGGGHAGVTTERLQ